MKPLYTTFQNPDHHYKECWCPGVRRPIVKYLAVRPNVACANRYEGYVASG